MFGIGAPELILIVIVALIFIGPQKLPEVARTFGKTYREFQRAMNGVKAEFTETSESFNREVQNLEKPLENILDAPQKIQPLTDEEAQLLDAKKPGHPPIV
jgi:Tat protein translocase TatB subunit